MENGPETMGKVVWRRRKCGYYVARIRANNYEIIRYFAEGRRNYGRWLVYGLREHFGYIPAFHDLARAKRFAEKHEYSIKF